MNGLSGATTGDYRETIISKAGVAPISSCLNGAEDPGAGPGGLAPEDFAAPAAERNPRLRLPTP